MRLDDAAWTYIPEAMVLTYFEVDSEYTFDEEDGRSLTQIVTRALSKKEVKNGTTRAVKC